MLMMLPLFCARMIGITCLAARMQLFRLIATQRSKASSVMSSSSASPPDRLTPRSEEHTSELQSHLNLVCRLLLEKKNSTRLIWLDKLRDRLAFRTLGCLPIRTRITG